jgi:radical SAM superfamily enzyme YgiQ (UPF0313 family)
MPTHELIEVIKYLKETFPSIERITSYARSKTIYRKTLEELKGLRAAGLNRLHVGWETGDEELLKHIDKGDCRTAYHSWKKAKEAGLDFRHM